MSQQFTTLVEHVPVGLFQTDDDGQCTYLNPAARQLCDLESPEDWLDVLRDSDRDVARAHWAEARQRRERWTTRLLLKNKKWIELTFVPTNSGWSGTLLDVTDCVRRERAEQTSEVLFSAVPDLIFVFDEHDRYTLYRSGSDEKLVAPRDQILGSKLDTYLPPALTARLRAARDEARRSGEIVSVDYELVTLGGPALFEARIGSLPDGGWMGIVRDVTEQRRREQAVADALKEATRANRARTRFLANVSHELRTPLNGVLGMAELLESSGLGPRQRAYLEVLRKSGTTLLTLIDDLLDLTRIESDSEPIELSPVPLDELLGELVALHRVEARRKAVQLELHAESPLAVRGNEVRLRQIISNLIVNALKFTGRGRVGVQAERRGEQVVLRVCDSGPGVPADKREAIFEPFMQADTSIARKHGGSGLGLTIARDLAQRMGGSLKVVQGPVTFRGACFELVLDADEPPQAPRAKPAGRVEPPRASLTIIVAEDTEANAMLLRLLLESVGHTVHVAPNGAEALALATSVAADVMLLDLHMPDMDGYETLRRLRSAGVELPVVAVTADVLPQTKQRCREAGMVGFLGKPFNGDELWRALGEAIEAGSPSA